MDKIDEFKISRTNLADLFDESGQPQKNVQEVLGISDAILEKYYESASNLLSEKHWTDAVDAFLFLTFVSPFVQNFWIGLGIAEQSTSEYDKAITAYLIAEALNPENPVPVANAFQCFLALGEKNGAAQCWSKAVELCGDKAEWKELKQNLMKCKKS